jgi:hypothetical protein
MSEGNSGIAAMVECAGKLGQQLAIETLSCGRDGLAPKNSCFLELCGANVFYSIKLDNDWLSLSIQLMDDPSDSLELLMTFGDNPGNWKEVYRLVCAIEKSGITTLQPRPLEIGDEDGGPHSWVIS